MDTDSDGLDPKEFRAFLRAQLANTPELEELDAIKPSSFKQFFQCLDKGGDGRISKSDLFGFMLKQATVASGFPNVTALLKSFPELTRGVITPPKFESVVIQIGFDALTADTIFKEMDKDHTGEISFGELEAWSRATLKNNDVKLFDGTRPLDQLSNILERGRVSQKERRFKQHKLRREKFSQLCQEDPSILEVRRKLGLVIPTDEDKREAQILGKELRGKARSELIGDGGPDSVIDMLEGWDLNGNGALGLKEFHEALVLIDLPESSAAATQVLFDHIDTNGSYTLTFAELSAFITTDAPIPGPEDEEAREERE